MRAPSRRVVGLLSAILAVVVSVLGLPPLLAAIDAVISEPIPSDKAPTEDTAPPAPAAPGLPPEVLP